MPENLISFITLVQQTVLLILVPDVGFELTTYRLQGGCSTTELQGQNFCGSLYIETLLTPQGDQVDKLQLSLLTPDNQIWSL